MTVLPSNTKNNLGSTHKNIISALPLPPSFLSTLPALCYLYLNSSRLQTLQFWTFFGDSQLVILHTHVKFGHAQTSQSSSSSLRALLRGFTTAPLSGLLPLNKTSRGNRLVKI